MRPIVPPNIESLSPYVPGKPIEETEREYGLTGVIKLASNENPLGPSPLALQAIQRSLSQLHLYPDGSGYTLKHKLAARHGVAPDEILLGNGSNEIIELLIRTFLSGDDEALICEGSFVMYKLSLRSHGRAFVEAPMRNRAYDLEAMADRLTPRTRLVFIANPDNPTGTAFGRAELERFLARLLDAKSDALVVMDEAYIDYVTNLDVPDSLEYRKDFKNLVTLRTFSKIHGLAGVRLGYAVIDRVLADYLNRTRMPFNVSSLALNAGAAALDDADHIARTKKNNAEGIALLSEELRRLSLDFLPSQASFFFVDLGRPAGPVYESLLRRGVITRPIPGYGFPNALRISVGTRPECERLLAGLCEVLRER
jgi:histidinol-phosphate aminotransferase